MAAGYSGTPLAKKLGIKPGAAVLLVNAPADFESLLEGLPESAAISRIAKATPPKRGAAAQRACDVIVGFETRAAKLPGLIEAMRPRMAPACGLWIAWPKKASGVSTDITEDVVRRHALEASLVDNKVCAIDATWSGLRLVIRLKDR